jgi:hypothetical protein
MNISQKMTLTTFIITGLIAGILLAMLSPGVLDPMTVASPARAFIIAWVKLYGLMFLLGYPYAQSYRQLIITTAIASFLASMPLYFWTSHKTLSQYNLILLSAYAINAFHIHYCANQWRTTYSTYFEAVWGTATKLLTAAIFMAACWAVLYLCGELFALIHFDAIKTLNQSRWFEIFATTFFISMGLFVASKVTTIICNVQQLVTLVCQYLLVPLSIMGVLFIFGSVITAAQYSITQSSQAALLGIAVLSVIFLNGYYRDGNAENNQHPALHWILRAFLWITPLFALRALFVVYQLDANSIHLRGFNIANTSNFICISVLLIYNIAYAIMAMSAKKTWLKHIEKINITLGVFLIMVSTLTAYRGFLPATPNLNYLQSSPSAKPAVNASWSAMTNNTLRNNAFIMGYNPKPIYLCRIKNGTDFIFGTIQNNTCVAINGKTITTNKSFDVFIQTNPKLTWSTSAFLTTRQPRVILAVSATGQPVVICRTIYNNQIHVGIDENYQCHFIANGNIVHSRDIPQYLYLN